MNDTVKGMLGGGSSSPSPAPAPQAGQPPSYTPPAHGTNPHAEGTPVVVDITPEDTEPLPYEEGGGSEDIVVGASRGEQVGDEYHGHVTILALLGTELLGVDTAEGETSDGPLGDLNALLDDICTASSLCLNVLDVDSDTTDNGSSNTFSVASASVGPEGQSLLDAGVVESEGTISEGSGCQTATGSSSVADADVAGGLVVADVIDSSSESRACRNGTETVEQDSQAVGLNGTDLLGVVGCTSGTPDTNAGIPAVLELVCNPDDSSEAGGTQNDAPFGVREGVTVFPLTILGDLLKATTAASESRAVAPDAEGPECPDPNNPDCPPVDECPDPDNPDCPPNGSDDECPDPTNPDCPDITVSPSGAGGGPGDDGTGAGPGDDGTGGPSAGSPDDTLAFTGADLGTLGAIGIAVMAIGLGLMALADRRREAVRA